GGAAAAATVATTATAIPGTRLGSLASLLSGDSRPSEKIAARHSGRGASKSAAATATAAVAAAAAAAAAAVEAAGGDSADHAKALPDLPDGIKGEREGGGGT
ncbi:unnamed protein product, partial [Laminaria digitata]